ncbi:unnamed protein product [Paramecium sonneborni]|uniref:Uncharacterized protein n=1 Tax=Paramecium sonneborni TaxID=65129 RepID=A0A8S1R9C7_9CILI|nr:unnamed protein product [Paramecium sonneborni]
MTCQIYKLLNSRINHQQDERQKVCYAVNLIAEHIQLEKNYKCKYQIKEIAQLIMKTILILIDKFNYQSYQIGHSFKLLFNAQKQYPNFADVKINFQLSLTQQLLEDYKRFILLNIVRIIFNTRLDVKYYKINLIKDFNEFLTILFFCLLKEGLNVKRIMILF